MHATALRVSRSPGNVTEVSDFEQLVERHRRELYVHCYRMLGSALDAEDALQESLLAAWRGFEGFEGRSSARTWLYRVCTNACLRYAERKPARVLTPDHGPAFAQTGDLGEPVPGSVWLEPLITEEDTADVYIQREGVELAFVAALQHLPGTQRAVLILREVLGYSAAEVADMLDTTAASVNSAMQRARQSVEERVPERSQQAELAALGEDGLKRLVDDFVAAWERPDLDALVALLADDAQFTMPPLPAWFDGRDNVAMFFRERIFETAWRIRAVEINCQPGVATYIQPPGEDGFTLNAVNVLSLRDGRISRLNSFLDPTILGHTHLPPEPSVGDR